MSERRVRRRKPRLKFDKQMYKKLGILFWIVVLALFALCTRIAYLNVAKGDNYSIKVLEQQSFTSKTIPYKRGDIKDRNGNVLATSVMVYNLIIDSKVVMSNEKYLTPTVNALVKYFDFNEDDLRTAIKERKNNSYWVAKKNLEYKDIQKFESYLNYEYADTKEEETTVQNTKGVWFEKKYKRMYPYNNLACSLLGFANSDNSATIGIESSYNSFLQGTDGREYGYMDSDNNMETVIKDAKDGDNIVSSIDMNIQRIVQKSIKKYMKKYSPKRISVVIANPNNGEILAMADDTTFDLNNPYKLIYETDNNISAKEKQKLLNKMWRNQCINDTYEPGSTFKVVTATAALEEGAVTIDSKFNCPGFKIVEDRKIRCHKITGHGSEDFLHGTMNSCNPVFIEVGLKVGAKNFYKYLGKLGLLNRTGIDIPGEASTIIHKIQNVGEVELATMSFGQSFQITPMQYLVAASAVVNGGTLVTPHFAVKAENADNKLVEKFQYKSHSNVISKNTSETMKFILEKVVSEGTGSKGQVPGFKVGGKTATSQKLPRGSGRYIASYMSFAPADKPKVIAMAIIDEPKGIYYGGQVAAPLISQLYKNILPYLLEGEKQGE